MNKTNKSLIDQALDHYFSEPDKPIECKQVDHAHDFTVHRALNRVSVETSSKEAITQADFRKVLSQLELNKRKHPMRKYYWVASVVILVLTICYFSFEFDNDSIHYTTHRAQTSTIELLDQSQVRLAEMSNLTLQSGFNNKRRLVEFEGQAVFDIAKNPEKPFEIRTHYGEVRVLGTRFKLNVEPGSSRLRLFLEEGKVSLYLDEMEQSYELLPNEYLIYNNKLKKVEKVKFSENIQFDLNSDKISFTSVSFHEVVNFINVQFDTRITIKNNKIKSIKLNGHFKTQSVSQILQAFQDLVGFEFAKTNDKRIEIY